MLYNRGKLEESLGYYLKCKEIFEETLPRNHLDLATLYNNLAIFLQNEGNFSESLSFFLKCKKIREEVLPVNHPDLANIYNNLRFF